MKSLFIDSFNELTIFSTMLISILMFVLLIVGIDLLVARSCNNYEEMTGRESKYIFFDACYVKTDEDKWIRYDKSYKE